MVRSGSIKMYTQDDLNNFLAHYGKIGMKWGRRSGKTVSTEHASLRNTKKNKAKTLTDAELKSAIDRMKLEKQYRDLNPKGISAGHKAVIAVLALGATANAAIAFASSPAGKAVSSGVKNVISRVIKN